MKKAPFTEDELRAVIKESVDRELEIFRSYADYPEHPFRDDIETKLETLCRNVENGNIKSASYRMGFTFYAKRCIAAVLIIFTMACITMPETVVAAYHKLIEVVETVFEEYTEFRYSGNNNIEIESKLKMVEIELLSDDWREVKHEKTENSLKLIYVDNNDNFFVIYQKIMPANFNLVSSINAENTKKEIVKVKNEEVELIYGEDITFFIWIHDKYYLNGETNSDKEEIIKFLECVKW